MKQLIGWIAGASAIASVAVAQQVYTYDNNNLWREYPLLVHSHKKIFEMSKGVCLRGPLVIYDHDEKEVFKLESGAYYPADCK